MEHVQQLASFYVSLFEVFLTFLCKYQHKTIEPVCIG